MTKAADLWLEFLGPVGAVRGCGLCGNSGIVDTRGRMFTPAGQPCGVLAFCICPNGRVMKKKGADLQKAASNRVGGLR
jgi:hypothetical protein